MKIICQSIPLPFARLFSLMLIIISSQFSFVGSSSSNSLSESPLDGNLYPPDCLVKNGHHNFDMNSLEKAPWGIVDLDQPPQHRYTTAFRPFRDKIRRMVDSVKSMLRSFVGQTGVNLVELLMSKIHAKLFPSPYKEEIEGISQLSGVSIPDLAALNLFYEMVHLCTSIVAENPLADEIFHARNLDFGIMLGWDQQKHGWRMTKLLRELTINLNFTHQGRPLYFGTTFAGHLGLFTGMRPRAFSISVNSKLRHDFRPLIRWIARILWPNTDDNSSFAPSPTPVLWALRTVLETCPDFGAAHQLLASVPLLSGCYFVLGGNRTGQAMVLMRNATFLLDERGLGPAAAEHPWFLLQRNKWKTPNMLDRIAGTKQCLERLGRFKLDMEGLMAVLSSKNTLNKSTVHSTIMRVQSGFYETFLQKCTGRCWFI